jgi:hypothetical protein
VETIAVLQAEEPVVDETAPPPAIDEIVPKAGSKRIGSVGDDKKGKVSFIVSFIDREDELLCFSWLSVCQDAINGAQQKGVLYWRKLSQDYQ